LKIYKIYVNNFEVANKRYNFLTNKNKKFINFCNQVKVQKASNSLDLISFLVMPCQRLPRYELLLRELLKQSAPESEDSTNITELLSEMSTVNEYVNSGKGTQEKREKLYKLNGAIKHKINIFDKHDRKLILDHDSIFVIFVEKNDKENYGEESKGWKKRVVFLFDDLVIIAKGNKYKFDFSLELKFLKVLQREENNLIITLKVHKSKIDVAGKEKILLKVNNIEEKKKLGKYFCGCN